MLNVLLNLNGILSPFLFSSQIPLFPVSSLVHSCPPLTYLHLHVSRGDGVKTLVFSYCTRFMHCQLSAVSRGAHETRIQLVAIAQGYHTSEWRPGRMFRSVSDIGHGFKQAGMTLPCITTTRSIPCLQIIIAHA